ncbi:hypothetical protein AAMO2058_000963300 [Amorphochlora amoebiformis]
MSMGWPMWCMLGSVAAVIAVWAILTTEATWIRGGEEEFIISQRFGDEVGVNSTRCHGWGSSETPSNPNIPAIVYSYLVFGHPMRIRLVLENALEYTNANSPIVVHISRPLLLMPVERGGEGGHVPDQDLDWILNQNASRDSRIWVNPSHRFVRRFTGTILAAHLANYEYAKSLYPNLSHVVFMSCDLSLLRNGSEEYVRKHDISFGFGFAGNRYYNLSEWRENIRNIIFSGGITEALRNTYHDKIPSPWKGHMKSPQFQKLISGGLLPKSIKLLNRFAVEGSFYKREFLDSFMTNLKDSGAFEALPRAKNIAAEELWLPSYLLFNKEGQKWLMNTKFSPPIIARMLTGNRKSEEFVSGALGCMLSHPKPPQTLSHVPLAGSGITVIQAQRVYNMTFGVKFVWPRYESDTVLLAREKCPQRDATTVRAFDPFDTRSSKLFTTVDEFFDWGCERRAGLRPLEQLRGLPPRDYLFSHRPMCPDVVVDL